MTLKTFHIMPGYLCNYSCSHCANGSGPSRKERLKGNDSLKIISDLNQIVPETILFTGGEPTLHIEEVNSILNGYNFIDKSNVVLTTNGWFAVSKDRTEDVLNRIVKINKLQMSFDFFHTNESNFEAILFLKEYCEYYKIEFNISICIENPEQILAANEIVDKTGVNVIYQKVEASGRSVSYDNAYKYLVFDKSVWEKSCPNQGSLHHGPDFGYTTCCSNLIFNNKASHGLISNDSLKNYKKSKFYSLIQNNSLREICEKFNMSILDDLDPKYSSPCRLCEKIFSENLDKL